MLLVVVHIAEGSATAAHRHHFFAGLTRLARVQNVVTPLQICDVRHDSHVDVSDLGVLIHSVPQKTEIRQLRLLGKFLREG